MTRSRLDRPALCYHHLLCRAALQEDLTLCGSFLELDGRNFHCWAHRMWVAEKIGLSASEDLEFTTKIIMQVLTSIAR